jgi:hypothetical protein
MKILRSLLFCAALSSLAAGAAADDLTPQKRADIERLLEMTGATRVGAQMATLSAAHMVQTLKASHPEIPQKALDSLPPKSARSSRRTSARSSPRSSRCTTATSPPRRSRE